MKVFVTGACGQLGHDVVTALITRGHKAIAGDIVNEYGRCQKESTAVFPSYIQLDITDEAAVENALLLSEPDAVIHCAAWTAVDDAEDHEDAVRAVNTKGTENIAKACRKLNCKMMYISTDYVFSGQGETPWEPDCKDYLPLSVYGKTKLEGELAVTDILDRFFIVRIAWAFGLNGKNFVETMISLGQTRSSLHVVNDQIGTPTYTSDAARLLVDMIETEKYGYYHVTNEGNYISWADYAREIFRQAGMDTEVIPVTSKDYGSTKAVRPGNSRLDRSKLIKCGFEPLPTWKDALSRYLKERSSRNH